MEIAVPLQRQNKRTAVLTPNKRINKIIKITKKLKTYEN